MSYWPVAAARLLSSHTGDTEPVEHDVNTPSGGPPSHIPTRVKFSCLQVDSHCQLHPGTEEKGKGPRPRS
eukprot:scaffold83579_cov41-Tisochrysis_lutea.AAC.2